MNPAAFRTLFRTLLRALLTLFLLTSCVFVVLHLTGDPARLMLGPEADAHALATFREAWGLDKNLFRQFLTYLGKLVRLDMGRSYVTGLPTKDVFLAALGPTMRLMVPTALVTLLLGIPVGVFAALRRDTAVDRGLMLASVFGYAVPNFFFGILLLLVFSIGLGWLPSYGDATPWHYIMPVLTISTSEAAIFSRFTRGAMIDSLNLPCVRAAAARGLPRRRVIWLHALPNALLGILTVLGFFLGTLVAGAVVTENIFSWPGIGRLLVLSVAQRDIPMVQLIVLTIGASLIVANLSVDLLATFLNPKLRKG